MSNTGKDVTDLELIAEVRNGKRNAFTTLMRRYQERLYWVARRMVGSHADADDIVQETFVKAYLGLGEFRGDSSFYTWLYRIAVNLSLNFLRKQQMLRYVRESELLRGFFPSKESPEADLEMKETQTALDRAVASLPDKQRAVFVLRFFDELSYEDISAVLKTSIGGLKANYFHALRKVQDFMRDETGTDKE